MDEKSSTSSMTHFDNPAPPTLQSKPLYPVIPGSALSNLLESTNPTISARYPKIMSPRDENEKKKQVPPRSSKPITRSKIPVIKPLSRQSSLFSTTKTSSTSASAPTTPTNRSRASSPSSVSSFGSQFHSRSRPSTAGGFGFFNKPPLPPNVSRKDMSAIKRQPRLAYGIYGEEYKKMIATTKSKPIYPKDVRRMINYAKNKKIPITNDLQLVHHHGRPRFEIDLLDDDNDSIISEGLELELLSTVDDSSVKSIINQQDQEQQTEEYKNEQCSLCEELKVELEKTQTLMTKYEERVQKLRDSLDDANSKYAKLEEESELQLFEIMEKRVEPEIKDVVDTATDPGGWGDKLNFPPDGMLLSYINDKGKGQSGMNCAALKMALVCRDSLLQDISEQIEQGRRILQSRCTPLLLPSSSRTGGTGSEDLDCGSGSRFIEIFPPEADKALHGYRKFVRQMHTYIEESLKEIEDLDKKILMNLAESGSGSEVPLPELPLIETRNKGVMVLVTPTPGIESAVQTDEKKKIEILTKTEPVIEVIMPEKWSRQLSIDHQHQNYLFTHAATSIPSMANTKLNSCMNLASSSEAQGKSTLVNHNRQDKLSIGGTVVVLPCKTEPLSCGQKNDVVRHGNIPTAPTASLFDNFDVNGNDTTLSPTFDPHLMMAASSRIIEKSKVKEETLGENELLEHEVKTVFTSKGKTTEQAEWSEFYMQTPPDMIQCLDVLSPAKDFGGVENSPNETKLESLNVKFNEESSPFVPLTTLFPGNKNEAEEALLNLSSQEGFRTSGQGDKPSPSSSLAAAISWLEKTPSPSPTLNKFMFKADSIAKLFDPIYNKDETVAVVLPEENQEEPTTLTQNQPLSDSDCQPLIKFSQGSLL